MIGAPGFEVALPTWCVELAESLPARMTEVDDRIALAIELSRRNVETGSGGPFGAVVSTANGRLVALGVNRVEADSCSSAHAEIVALSLAQAAAGTWNLADIDGAPVELATSCEPCAMCLGAIPWSGIRRLVCAASKDDAERTGFDEGARDPDWIAMLKRRGIATRTGLRRREAAAILHEYRDRGAPIYNP